jgi:hypothetical protein
MLHTHDGWYFDRQGDGSVRIVRKEGPGEDARILDQTEFSQDEWLSVVAETTERAEVPGPNETPNSQAPSTSGSESDG